MKLLLGIISILGITLAEPIVDVMNIQVYSEYYYEGVMVEIEAIVSGNDAAFNFELLVPAETDSVFLIKGVPNKDSQIIPLDVNDVHKTGRIQFGLVDPQFRLFIFYNPYDDSPHKQFTFLTGSNIELKNVHVSIQEPVMATAFTIDREITSETQDQHGINFSAVHLGDIPVGHVEKISISYMNTSGKTSIENLREQLQTNDSPKPNPHNVVEDKPKRHSLLLWEPIAIFSVLAIFIGFLYYSKMKNEKPVRNEGKNFCSSCGNKITTSAKFCSNCGGKLG